LDPNFKALLGSIKRIKEAAHEGNEANLGAATKQLGESSVLILSKYTPKIDYAINNSAESNNTQNGERDKESERAAQILLLLERLRLAIASVINSAKLLFGNPQNNSFVSQYDKEASEVAKTVSFLFFYLFIYVF
jgi:hypothetical protein